MTKTAKFQSPAMVGRMTPPLFSQRAFTEPNDARFTFSAMWYWMHAEGCWAGSFKANAVHRERWLEADWSSTPTAPAEVPTQTELFA